MTETTTAQTMAVLAELVLMATRHNLPMPLYLTASEKNSQLNLTLNNRADLEAWHQVFGGGRLWECAPTASSPSVLVTNMHSGSMLGWSVNLQANVPLPLSPEVLAALGEAARSDAAVLVAEAVAVLKCAVRQGSWFCQLPAGHGGDCAPEAVAVLDEPKARRWRDREGDEWEESGDRLRLAEPGVTGTTDRAFVENAYGPLVEVTP